MYVTVTPSPVVSLLRPRLRLDAVATARKIWSVLNPGIEVLKNACSVFLKAVWCALVNEATVSKPEMVMDALIVLLLVVGGAVGVAVGAAVGGPDVGDEPLVGYAVGCAVGARVQPTAASQPASKAHDPH